LGFRIEVDDALLKGMFMRGREGGRKRKAEEIEDGREARNGIWRAGEFKQLIVHNSRTATAASANPPCWGLCGGADKAIRLLEGHVMRSHPVTAMETSQTMADGDFHTPYIRSSLLYKSANP
jgi:hypothetical protein